MTEIERIDEQLRRAFEGEAWHGPSVLEAFGGLSHAEAAAHPVAGAHSAWELALHLTGTYRLVLRRLDGDGRQMSGDEDWPVPPPATAEAWAGTIRLLVELNRDVRRAVGAFPAERLHERLVPEAPYPAYTQFIGITQHDLYHAGQVMILKRALRADREGNVFQIARRSSTD